MHRVGNINPVELETKRFKRRTLYKTYKKRSAMWAAQSRHRVYLVHHPSVLVGGEAGGVQAHLEAVWVEDGLLLGLLLTVFLLRDRHLGKQP